MATKVDTRDKLQEANLKAWVRNCNRNLENWEESLKKTKRAIAVAKRELQEAIDDLADFQERMAEGKPQKCRSLDQHTGKTCDRDRGHKGKCGNTTYEFEVTSR